MVNFWTRTAEIRIFTGNLSLLRLNRSPDRGNGSHMYLKLYDLCTEDANLKNKNKMDVFSQDPTLPFLFIYMLIILLFISTEVLLFSHSIFFFGSVFNFNYDSSKLEHPPPHSPAIFNIFLIIHFQLFRIPPSPLGRYLIALFHDDGQSSPRKLGNFVWILKDRGFRTLRLGKVALGIM